MVNSVFTQKDDETFINGIVRKFEIARKTTASKAREIFETMVKPKLDVYFEKLKNTNPYIAEHPHIIARLMELIEKAFGVAKAQQPIEDVKKNV